LGFENSHPESNPPSIPLCFEHPSSNSAQTSEFCASLPENRNYFSLEHAEHKIIVRVFGDDDKGSRAGIVDMFDIKAIHDDGDDFGDDDFYEEGDYDGHENED